MITVTKPFMPPIEEYQRFLDGIWFRQWLTNNGPLVNELELKLKEYLKVPHLIYVSNGTVALQIAIKALDLTGEIITTPFSFVATSSCIVWEGCSPIYVDIERASFNIDPTKIEEAITERTSAILATHVYGNPCNIDAIEKIALKHNLKVIYDGAHGFGTKYKGKSIFSFGDISTASFHSTKLFHTIEGGALFTNDSDLARKIDVMRNFGYNGPTKFDAVGINGKNSEFHAAMGLCNLKYIGDILNSRKIQSDRYNDQLSGLGLDSIKVSQNAEFNYAYYTAIFENEETNLRVIKALEANRISPRRYFYPSLNTTELYRSGPLTISDGLAARIVCLPLYYSLSLEEIDFICRIIKAEVGRAK